MQRLGRNRKSLALQFAHRVLDFDDLISRVRLGVNPCRFGSARRPLILPSTA